MPRPCVLNHKMVMQHSMFFHASFSVSLSSSQLATIVEPLLLLHLDMAPVRMTWRQRQTHSCSQLHLTDTLSLLWSTAAGLLRAAEVQTTLVPTIRPNLLALGRLQEASRKTFRQCTTVAKGSQYKEMLALVLVHTAAVMTAAQWKSYRNPSPSHSQSRRNGFQSSRPRFPNLARPVNNDFGPIKLQAAARLLLASRTRPCCLRIVQFVSAAGAFERFWIVAIRPRHPRRIDDQQYKDSQVPQLRGSPNQNPHLPKKPSCAAVVLVTTESLHRCVDLILMMSSCSPLALKWCPMVAADSSLTAALRSALTRKQQYQEPLGCSPTTA